MKILLVNKFHYLRGGSEKYYFELGNLLKRYGHEVAYFSMKDERNITTSDKEYFVENIDFNNCSKIKALNIIYSKKTKKVMHKALEDFKPDIVHLNNFQRQLTSSIIKPIKKANIPIIYTAHDLQAICPASTMLDSKINTCEQCIKGKYINCVKKGCIKGSRLKSILGAVEGYFYKVNKVYRKQIDYIITPSEFYRNKLIDSDIHENKIKTIHNSIDSRKYKIEIKDYGYALYFGRLSSEKGILNLINAFMKTKEGKLYIAGEGPEKANIEQIIKENKLEKRVKILGFLNQNEIKKHIAESSFVVIPSIWYENCPYSILETQAIGKPIIASKMGGIPELIEEDKNGYLYECNDINKLTKLMRNMFEDEKKRKDMSEYSKKLAKEKYSEESYYNELIKIYEQLIGENYVSKIND